MDLIVGVNSYMTVEEADELVENVFFDTEEEYKLWNSLSESSKSKLIYRATKLIETMLFLGRKTGQGPLNFPRFIWCKNYECPDDVKIAILKQGLKSLSNQGKSEVNMQEMGIKSYSIKGASISFSDSLNVGRLSNGVYQSVYETYLAKWTY